MYKSPSSVIAAFLTYACISLRLKATDGQPESQSCSQIDKMVECAPEIRKFMDRQVNLTTVMNAAGSDQNVIKRCQQFNQLLACLGEKMRDCQEVVDAHDQVIVFFENAKKGVNYICNEKREAFVRNQPCIASETARRAVIACDSDDSHSRRRRRHTCEDYNREILCADRAVIEKCGKEAAGLVGQLARIFLKNTPHTKDCTAPAFSLTSGSTIGVIYLPLLVGVCFVSMQFKL